MLFAVFCDSLRFQPHSDASISATPFSLAFLNYGLRGNVVFSLNLFQNNKIITPQDFFRKILNVFQSAYKPKIGLERREMMM